MEPRFQSQEGCCGRNRVSSGWQSVTQRRLFVLSTWKVLDHLGASHRLAAFDPLHLVANPCHPVLPGYVHFRGPFKPHQVGRSKIFRRSQYSVSLFVNKTALGRLTLFAEYPQVPKNILDPNLRVPVSLDCAIFLLQGPGHEKSHFANNHHAAAAAAGAHWPCTLQPGRSGSQLGIRTTRLFSAFPHHCSRSDFEQTDILRGFDEERASRLTSALVVSCSSLSSLKGFWRLTH